MALTGVAAAAAVKAKQTVKDSISQKRGKAGAAGARPVVVPAGGFAPTYGVSEANLTVTEDRYRHGVEGGIPPRSIDPFEMFPAPGVVETASLRVYGTRTGNAAKATGKKEFDLIPAYTKFILESSQESRSERHQVIQTFSDFYVFFFGEQPPVFTFSGTLINTKNVNWVNDFYFYYEKYLRGTKCVEENARIVMSYGGRQIEGYMLGVNFQTNAATESGVPFSFQLLVTRRNIVGLSDDFSSIVGPNGISTTDEELKKILKTVAGPEGTGTSAPKASVASEVIGGVMKGLPAARMLPA